MKKPDEIFDEGRLWLFYKNAFSTIDKLLSPAINEAGLTATQARILLFVYESGEIPVGELSERLGMNSGNCSTMCKKLEKSGQINRCRSRDDERVVLLSITDRGRRLCRKIMNTAHEMHRTILENIPGRERNEILCSLNRIEAFLKTPRHSDSFEEEE